MMVRLLRTIFSAPSLVTAPLLVAAALLFISSCSLWLETDPEKAGLSNSDADSSSPDPVASPPTECTRNSDCNDQLFCNGIERCVQGQCVAGQPPTCSDDVDCTNDTCDENLGACLHIASNTNCDGTQVCNPTTGCGNTACTTPDECDNGNHCDGREQCISSQCVAATQIPVCESIGCELAHCDPFVGCVKELDHEACNEDGIDCTFEECLPGGSCAAAVAKDELCDDQRTCTLDYCLPQDANDKTGCYHYPQDWVCQNQDIDPPTHDVCRIGLCVGDQGDPFSGCANAYQPCNNPNEITPGPVCNLKDGQCYPGKPCEKDEECDDGSACNGIEKCESIGSGNKVCVQSSETCTGFSGQCDFYFCRPESLVCDVYKPDLCTVVGVP